VYLLEINFSEENCIRADERLSMVELRKQKWFRIGHLYKNVVDGVSVVGKIS
jgi:hypothetical protein